MGIVVSDTGPINYLLLIGRIELLSALFDQVAVPEAVHRELLDSGAPDQVRDWASKPPAWVEVDATAIDHAIAGWRLGAGESAAIALALKLGATLLLSDDRAAVAAARSRQLAATGTIGVLIRAARSGLVDLEAALEELGRTNFRRSASLFAAIVADEKSR